MPFNEDVVHLFLLPLGPKLQQWEWKRLLENIPSEERANIIQYKQWQDQQRALLGQTLLRWMLKNDLKRSDVKISRNEAGRPYLSEEGVWAGDFNLSHSGEWIVAAICKYRSVGVDVEKVDVLNEEILSSVLAEEELMTIKQLPTLEQTKKFYELWTMKESIYKMGIFPELTLESINTFEFKKKEIETHTFYIDPQHPISISWNGAPNLVIKKTVLTKDELMNYSCHKG